MQRRFNVIRWLCIVTFLPFCIFVLPEQALGILEVNMKCSTDDSIFVLPIPSGYEVESTTATWSMLNCSANNRICGIKSELGNEGLIGVEFLCCKL